MSRSVPAQTAVQAMRLSVPMSLWSMFVMSAGCFDYPDKVGAHERAPEVQDSGGPGDDDTTQTGDAPELIDDGVGLPCEVERLLATHCRGCHGASPTGDSPMSLVTRQDLLAPGRIDMSRTIAQLSVSRMKSATKPMPPAPGAPVPEADIAAFERWVASGAPSGDCEPVPDPFAGPVTCSSGTWWEDEDDGSSRMFPGRACIDCHTREDDDDAPTFSVAGTVYPTGREPNDCNGVRSPDDVQVVITDALGRVYTLAPNRAGNFFLERKSSAPFAYPYTAKVVSGGGTKVRAMNTAQQSGDCNACHTQDGRDDAPGRVVIPY